MDRKKNIKIADIEPNKGQIKGLPQNPRFIKDNRFKQLVKSIEDAPEMLDYRTLLVFPHEKKYVIIAGNMRFRACKELGYKELPCYVLPEETPAEKLREYAIKDNIGFGADDWDILMNEWDTDELKEWGMEMPDDWKSEEEKTETERLSDINVHNVYYEPKKKPNIKLSDCFDTTLYEKKLAAVKDLIPNELMPLYDILARRFVRIDYEAIANYYAFNAGDDEKKAIERLRLVLIDDGVGGYIEDELLKIIKTAEDEYND